MWMPPIFGTKTEHKGSGEVSYGFRESTNSALSLVHSSNTYLFTAYTLLTLNVSICLSFFLITLALGKAKQVCQACVIFLYKTKL